jgi:DNA-binding LacI/PurR family transcriptional regulator
MSTAASTIRDVARHAAVSVSTVSNVLNGRRERMRAATLARVESAMAALQFRPSMSALALKTGHTPLLGLLVPSMANPMYGFIAREIERCAQERFGYRLLIGSTYRDAAKEAAFFEDLQAHGVRHVILISSLSDERHLDSAISRGMRVLSYDRRAAAGARSRVGPV